jgi:hypothetical protein
MKSIQLWPSKYVFFFFLLAATWKEKIQRTESNLVRLV